jgi:hypothetical protein
MKASGITHTASRHTAASTSPGRTTAASKPSSAAAAASTDHGAGPSLAWQPAQRPAASRIAARRPTGLPQSGQRCRRGSPGGTDSPMITTRSAGPV